MKTPLGRLLRWLFLTVVCVTLGEFAAAEELKLNDLAKNLGQGITKAKFKAVLVADFHGLDGNACSQGWYLAGQLIDAWHQHHQQFEIRNARLSVTDLQSAESLQRAASTSVADAVVTGTIEHNSDGYLLTTSLRRAADGAVVNTVRVLSPEGFGFPNTAQGTPAVRAGLNGVTIPTCLYCPIPGYSQEARDAKYQGTVVLSVIISPEGRASNVAVVKDPGLGLAEKAIEAVGEWKFKPASKDGNSVSTLVPIEVTFRLYNNR